MPNKPDWKLLNIKEREQAIRKAISDGVESAREIAEGFEDASRSAILGFCLRRDIELPGKDPRVRSRAIRRGQIKAAENGAVFRSAGKKGKTSRPNSQPAPTSNHGKIVTTPRAERAPEPEFIPAGIEFIRLTEHTCKWPLWDRLPADASTAKHCGQHTDNGPWCELHKRKATHLIMRTA